MKYKYLAELREGIPYRKSLRKYVGSVTATILIQQLDFHFANYPDGIYKFLSPTPGHSDYKEGDSWIEELAFSEKEFRTAFDQLGARHISKTSYLQAINPFIDKDGIEKYYCSYHDKQKGLTWYFRNHDKVDALIEKLILISPQKNAKRPTSKESTVTAQRESTVTAQRESTVTAQRESTVTAQRESTVDDHREPCNLPKGIYVTDERESTFIYKENTKNTSKEKEEDSPTPHATVVVVEPIEKEREPIFLSTIPDEASKSEIKFELVCTSEVSSFRPNVPAAENNNQIQKNASLSQEEYAVLKEAQAFVYNPASAPWRLNFTEFRGDVCKAVFAANPKWYSLLDGTTNLKQIDSRLKTLEKTIKGSDGVLALEAYKELMNYVRMADMSAAGISGKKILEESEREQQLQYIHNASKRKFTL